MLAAISSTRFCSSVARRLLGPQIALRAPCGPRTCALRPSGVRACPIAFRAPWRPLDVSGTANGAAGHSVLPCIDKERDNGLFAKSFGGFQPVQTLNKYEARAVCPD